MSNVVKYLKSSAERNPSRTAIAFRKNGGPEKISYSDLWSRVDRFSTALLERGLKPGDRVIVMIPMSVELYVAMLGIIKMGAVAVFADPWVKMEHIIRFCAFASPKGFIGIPKSHILRLYDGYLRKIPLTVTTGSKFAGLPARHTFNELLESEKSSEIYPARGSDPALITFTTGSGGIPKGANRTHGFLDAQNKALNTEFPIDDSDVDMPMFPVFALRNLAAGITSVFPEMDVKSPAAIDADAIFRQIKEFGVNTITASPPFIGRLAAGLPGRTMEIPIRRILSGGAPVGNDQLKSWRKSFENSDILVVYGSTEVEPVAHISLEEKIGAVSSLRPQCPGFCAGKPTFLVKTKIIRIVKDEIPQDAFSWSNYELGKGGIGELVVSGEHVCRDYFNNPQAVRENKIIDRDGILWHRMGDTGYFDDIGRFWLTGRVHSTIFKNGLPVHPQLVEQAAKGDDARISMVAAIGITDLECGEKVAVIVKLSDGKPGTASMQAISEDVRGRIENAGLAADFIVLTDRAFPLDPRHNSKIDYAMLKRRLNFKKLRGRQEYE
jgi:acyl-CoA synthetase (AMP-forming)/AMP-acid ligase II